MGNRISVSFRKGNDESVAVFSHWGGEGFANEAERYAEALKAEAKIEGAALPLYRLEPQTVVADFIRHISAGEKRITNDIYIGKDENDGDNSDNGHAVIELYAYYSTKL